MLQETELKTNFTREMKRLKNFLRCQQEISVTTAEGLHSQERGVSPLNQ